MAPKKSEDEIINNIICLLRILNYDGLENYDTPWVRSVLLEPGRSRTRLMSWVVDQVNSVESATLQNVATDIYSKKCLEILSKMGLCQPTDSDIIEGSAPAVDQLKFWKLCFEAILNLRQLAPTPQMQTEESHQANMALHCLAAAPHTAITLRGGGINLLPADLLDGYRQHQKAAKKSMSYKPEALEDQLQEILNKLEQLKNTEVHNMPLIEAQVDNENTAPIPIREPQEEYESIQASMVNSLKALERQQQDFHNVFKSSIEPWISDSTDAQMELSKAGQLIHETPPKLQKINELLHCMKNSSDQTKVLMDAVHPSMGGSYTSSISSTIQQIAETTTPSGHIDAHHHQPASAL